MPERAVSDVLGFIFVFSLIVASVGVVTVFGTSALEDARDQERVDNAVRAFEVLADNMDDIAREGAPSRATEIKLAGTAIEISDSVDLAVNASDVADPYPAEFRPIVFGGETATTIVYEGGAIIRAERDGAVMLREPNYLFSEDRTVIHYIETEASEIERVGGEGTVLVRGTHTVSRVLVARDVNDSVELTYTIQTTPTRAEAWNRYLESQIDWSNANTNPDDPCTVTGGTVECTFNSDELYVTTSRISVAVS